MQLSLPLTEECRLSRAFAWMLEEHDCKPSTLLMHRAHACYFLDGVERGGVTVEGLGDVDVRAIGYPEIMAWVRRERLHGLAKATVIKRLSTLKLGLLMAVEHGILDRLPQWPRLRSDSRASQAFWTHEHLRAALAACDDDDLGAWIMIGWWTGFHASDIDRFRWEDVDLGRGTWVRRNTKTSVPPIKLPLPGEFHAWLTERRERLAPHPRDLVVGRRQGHPNGYLRALARRAGIPEISTIGLRHSCESHMADRGVDPLVQQTVLGLTSMRMLAVYRHPHPKRIEREIGGISVTG